jgi:hypothetical protein
MQECKQAMRCVLNFGMCSVEFEFRLNDRNAHFLGICQEGYSSPANVIFGLSQAELIPDQFCILLYGNSPNLDVNTGYGFDSLRPGF